MAKLSRAVIDRLSWEVEYELLKRRLDEALKDAEAREAKEKPAGKEPV
jgi:hypothetical protein